MTKEDPDILAGVAKILFGFVPLGVRTTIGSPGKAVGNVTSLDTVSLGGTLLNVTEPALNRLVKLLSIVVPPFKSVTVMSAPEIEERLSAPRLPLTTLTMALKLAITWVASATVPLVS